MFTFGGHVLVSSNTTLGDPHDATRRLTSTLSCDVTVTDLRACGTLLGESEGDV